MNLRQIIQLCLAISLLIMFHQKSMADTVYQWTDADGMVHFSDVPPVNTAIEDTREISIDISPNEEIDPDKYSVINQVDRMEERRRQRTEERLEKKRLQLEAKRLALELEKSRQNTDYVNQEIYQPIGYVGYYEPYYYPQRRYGKGYGYSPHKSGYGSRYGKSHSNNEFSDHSSHGSKTSRVTFRF